MRSLFAVFSTVVLSSSLFAQSKIQPAAPVTPPAPTKPSVTILYECEADQCLKHEHGIWIFEGNSGEAVWAHGVVADLKVTSFDGKNIVIERIDRPESVSQQWADPATHTFHARYTATLSANGRSYDGHVSFDGDFNGSKSNIGDWTAAFGDGEVCEHPLQCSVGHEEMTVLGMNAFNEHLPVAAMKCFEAAKQLGDIDAEAMIGILTFKGEAVKLDQKAGIDILTATATAGSLVGQLGLAEVYGKGLDGVPKNPQLAALWKAAAEKTGHDRAMAQMAARRAAPMNGQDAAAWLILMAMGAGQGGARDAVSYNSQIDEMNYERGQEFHRENVDGCNGGDSAACGRAGMSSPNPD